MLDAAQDAAVRLEETLEDVITQRPLATVGLALGLGFLIGATGAGNLHRQAVSACRRSNTSRSLVDDGGRRSPSLTPFRRGADVAAVDR